MDPELEELQKLLEDQHKETKAGLEASAAGLTETQKKLQAQIDELAKKANRPGAIVGDTGMTAEQLEVKAAYAKFFRRGDDTELKAMQVGVDPDGGYTVQATLATEIFRVLRDVSPVRQVARIVQIEGDAYEEPQDRAGSSGASWVGETAARPATSSPQLGLLRVLAHEMYAMPEATQKVLDDNSFNVEGWLTGQKLPEEFAIAEGDAFVNGDGGARPRGFATYPTAATADTARAWGTFEHVATGASGAFAAGAAAPDCLIDLSMKLKPQYMAKATWMMSRSVAATIRKMKEATTNAFIWQPGLQAGMPPTLLGFPVLLNEFMPAVAANSLSIAFGDFSRGYTIAQRITMRMLRDPFTNKPYVRFYTTARVGGEVSDFHAIKFIKFA